MIWRRYGDICPHTPTPQGLHFFLIPLRFCHSVVQIFDSATSPFPISTSLRMIQRYQLKGSVFHLLVSLHHHLRLSVSEECCLSSVFVSLCLSKKGITLTGSKSPTLQLTYMLFHISSKTLHCQRKTCCSGGHRQTMHFVVHYEDLSDGMAAGLQPFVCRALTV